MNVRKLENKFEKILKKEYSKDVYVVIENINIYYSDVKNYTYSIKGRYGIKNKEILTQKEFKIEHLNNKLSYNNLIGIFLYLIFMEEV